MKKRFCVRTEKNEFVINSFLKVSLSQKKNHLLREVRSEGDMETSKFPFEINKELWSVTLLHNSETNKKAKK